MERDLNNPGLHSALRRVKEIGLLEHLEERFLDNPFCLTMVVQNAKCDPKHEPRVPVEEKIQRVRITCTEKSHHLFITGTLHYGSFRHADTACSTPVPNDRK